MSRKQLKMNRFGESILSEIDSFTFSVIDIHQKYPLYSNKNPDVYTLHFDWNWNGYTGCGEIHFYKSSYSLCNEFGENESYMTVSPLSQKQQPNGRSTCSLYNDDTMVTLFDWILSKTDRSNI